MKKLNLPALLFLIISLASGCRASDCGCPMSMKHPDEMKTPSFFELPNHKQVVPTGR